MSAVEDRGKTLVIKAAGTGASCAAPGYAAQIGWRRRCRKGGTARSGVPAAPKASRAGEARLGARRSPLRRGAPRWSARSAGRVVPRDDLGPDFDAGGAANQD